MKYISKWRKILNLEDWEIRTEQISDEQVVYPDDLEDKSFVGVERGKREAIIYHSRELQEDDVVHELLHLRFPKTSEDNIELLTAWYMSRHIIKKHLYNV